MAEPEVEAAWRAEFERSGVKELRDAFSGNGFTEELKRQAAFRWLGDEAEARRLQQEPNLPLCQMDLLGCRRCCDRRPYRSGISAIGLRHHV